MPETDIGQTEPRDLLGEEATEPGMLSIEEKPEETAHSAAATSTEARPLPPIPTRALERAGTIEHLAARRPVPELQEDAPEIKQRLTELRSDVTRLVTALRWGGASVETTTEHMLPLLDIGPVQQWKTTLTPFLYEIDRAGNLIPVWLKIIALEPPDGLPPNANPAETPVGRARRYATLMLGYYKTNVHGPSNSAREVPAERPVELRLEIQFANSTRSIQLNNQDETPPKDADEQAKTEEHAPDAEKEAPEQALRAALPTVLGKLAVDPDLSLYATLSLVRLATTQALQELVGALKDAEDWAKVDIVEGCLSLNQPRFYDLLLASGLDRIAGLESYVAIPLYQTIPLERYLSGGKSIAPRLTEQSTLVLDQVLQEGLHQPLVSGPELPPLFARDLPAITNALFEQARREPNWRNAITLHHLILLLGRYWSEIARRQIEDARISEAIGECLPRMPEFERWMAGPGRDVLLSTLTTTDTAEIPAPAIKVLGEMRDPRAVTPLIAYLETIKELKDRSYARQVSAACDALGLLSDRRALLPMQQLIGRVVDVGRRAAQPRRRENLPTNDPEIPASMVYGAVIRACGQFEDSSVLEQTLRATSDFDPFVRTQAIEALRKVDPSGNDPRSRLAMRAALEDPRDSVVKSAIQLATQYRDVDAFPLLQHIIDTRSELSPVAYDALRRMAQ